MSTLPPKVDQAINQQGFDPTLARFLNGWSVSSAEFRAYMDTYEGKIAKKLRGAKEIEDQRDVGLELYIAYALCSSGCTVTCEPHKKGPDLHVTLASAGMYVETRRIRDREATNEWQDICGLLRREVEPLLGDDMVVLSIIHSDHSYRYGRQPDLIPAIETFAERYDRVRDFIIEQIRHRNHAHISTPVSVLPERFASLSIEDHHEPFFSVLYPIAQGDEPSKLLRIASEKSRQVLAGNVNTVVLWIDAFGESCDDFETALRMRVAQMSNSPSTYSKRMGFQTAAEAQECWNRCSAFVVHDCEKQEAAIYLNPSAEHPLPEFLHHALQNGLQRPFRVP